MATRLDAENSILFALDEPAFNWATPTELHNMVQAAYQAAWDIILAKYEDYTVDSVDFTLTAANAGEWVLLSSSPAAGQIAVSSFYKLRTVMRRMTDGRYRAIDSFTLDESGGLWLGDGIGYMFMTSSIFIEPTELAPGQYRVWYVFNPAALTGDSSVIDDPLHGAVLQYVIDDVCCRLKSKDDQPPGPFEDFKKTLEARVDRMASHRDNRPRKIPDVRGRGSLRYRTGRLL